VCFICLEARKFDYTGRSAEDAIGADSVVQVFLGNAQTLVCLCLRDQPPLNLNLVLTVRRRLAPQTLFKLLSAFIISMGRRLSVCLRASFQATMKLVLIGRESGLHTGHGRVMVLGACSVHKHLSGRHFL